MPSDSKQQVSTETLVIPSELFTSFPKLYRNAAKLLEREGLAVIADDKDTGKV
jgi:hypothetical protein